MMEEFEIDRPEIKQFPNKLNKKIIKNLEQAFPTPSEKNATEDNENDDFLK